MNKFIKICALTGLILLLAGTGIASVSAALGGHLTHNFPHKLWDKIWYKTGYKYWDDSAYTDHDSGWTQWTENGLNGQTAPSSGTDAGNSAAGGTGEGSTTTRDSQGTSYAARKLDVDMDRGSIHIYEEEGISQIKVNIKDQFSATQCYMDNETLKIKREKTWYRAEEPKVEVLVPKGYKFDKVSVDMGASECHIDQIKTSRLDIDTGVGKVVFTGTVTGDVKLETGVGDITLNLSGRQEDYNYKIKCGVGTIHAGDSHYTMLSNETHVNNKAPYTMDLECGVGAVFVNFDE